MKIKEENITRLLHWGFAGFLLVILGIGFYMTNTEYSPKLYQMHKSFGVIFTLLIGIRFYWRMRHPWKSSAVESKYEGIIRNITHGLLMCLFFVMPILGLMCSGFSGFGVSLFNLEIISQNINLEGNIEPFNTRFYEMSKFTHKLLAKIFAGLIFMHIAVVLKHHFINKDSTLIKMLIREK